MTDHTPTPLLAIPSKWLEPGAVVPIDAETTRHLVRFVKNMTENMGKLRGQLADYKRLEEILEGRSDVVDGSYGVPEPNTAMSILTEWRGRV